MRRFWIRSRRTVLSQAEADLRSEPGLAALVDEFNARAATRRRRRLAVLALALAISAALSVTSVVTLPPHGPAAACATSPIGAKGLQPAAAEINAAYGAPGGPSCQ